MTLGGRTTDAMPDAETIARIILAARSDGVQGFGGACGEAAVAINRVLFDGRAEIVGVFNEAFFDRGRLVGHVAVRIGDVYWDADASPKTLDDIEHWGSLDPHDLDYAEQAGEAGIGWNETAATEVVAVAFDSDREVLEHFESGLIPILTSALETAKAAVLSPTGAAPR